MPWQPVPCSRDKPASISPEAKWLTHRDLRFSSRGNHHPATHRSKAFLTNGWSFLQAFLSWASLLRAIPDMFASLEETGRVCDEHRQPWALCPLTPYPAQPNRLASKKQGNQGSHPAPHAALDKLSQLPPPRGGGALPASWCRQLTREEGAGLPSPGPYGMRCDLHFMVTQSSREAKPQAQLTQLPGAAWGGGAVHSQQPPAH